MTHETLAWTIGTYFALLVLAVAFFKAGARYDQQSEQLYDLSKDREIT